MHVRPLSIVDVDKIDQMLYRESVLFLKNIFYWLGKHLVVFFYGYQTIKQLFRA